MRRRSQEANESPGETNARPGRRPRARSARIALSVLVFWILLPASGLELALRALDAREEHRLRKILASEDGFDLPSLGYNELPVARERAEDTFRILSFGDSFAHSIVRRPFSYAGVLEKRLATRTGRRVEVVNLGRPAVSFAHYLDEIDFWTRRLEFDAVILGVYAGNDFREASDNIQGVRSRPAKLESGTTEPIIPRRFGLRLLDHLHAARQVLGVVTVPEEEVYIATSMPDETRYLEIMDLHLEAYRPDTIAEVRQGLLLLEELLVRIERLEEDGAATFVFVAPSHAAVDPDLARRTLVASGRPDAILDPGLPTRLVETAAARAGYRRSIGDVRPTLVDAGGDLYFGTNTHWSAEGNAVVAEWMSERLQATWFGAGDAEPGPKEDPELASSFSLPGTEAPTENVERMLERTFRGPAHFDRWATARGLTRSPRLAGIVESVRHLGERSWISGWAGDEQHPSPVEVVVLVGGKPVVAGRPRFRLSEPRWQVLRNMGVRFRDRRVPHRFLLPAEDLCRVPWAVDDVRAIVLHDDHWRWMRVSPELTCDRG